MTTSTETKQGWTEQQEATINRLMETGNLTRRKAIQRMLKEERSALGPVAPSPSKVKARKQKAVTSADREVVVATPAFSLREAAAEADRLLKEGSLSQGLALVLTPLTGWAQKSLGYRDDQMKKAAAERKKGKR